MALNKSWYRVARRLRREERSYLDAKLRQQCNPVVLTPRVNTYKRFTTLWGEWVRRMGLTMEWVEYQASLDDERANARRDSE